MDDRYQDRKLVDGARSGDRACFERLFQLHHQAVYALAFGTLREKNTAASVLQDTFQTAWGSLHELPEGESFGLWVQRLCFLRCSALLRASGRAPELQDDAARELLTDADPATFRLPQPYAVRPELKDALERAVAALPDRQRQALVLYYNNGLSEAEAGAVLGVSAAQTRSYLAHARREIVRRLRQEERAAGLSLPWGEEDTVPFRDTMTAEILGGMLSTTSVGAILAAILASKGGAGKAAAGGAAKAGSLKSAISALVGKGGSAGAAAKAGGMSLAAKAGGMSLAAKTAVGLTAAAVVAGGGYGIKKAVDNGAADRAELVEETQPLEGPGAGVAAASVRVLDTVTVYNSLGRQICTESYDYDDNLYVIRSECDGDADIAVFGSFEYEYEYDADGRATSVRRDGTEVRAWSYDDAGHMTKQFYQYTYADDSGDGITTTYYTYDAQGNRTEMREVIEGVYPSDCTFRCASSPNDSGGVDLEMEMTSGDPDDYPYRFESYDAEGRITLEDAEYGQYYYYNDENGVILAEITPGDTVEHGSPYALVYFVLMDSSNKIYHRIHLGSGGDYTPTFDDDGNLTRVDFSDGAYTEFTYREIGGEPEDEPEPEDTSWKQAYLDCLQELADSDGYDLEDYTYSLVYIDDDSIPEMVLKGKFVAARSAVCTYHDGEVDCAQLHGAELLVLEREGLGMDTYYKASGLICKTVWEVRNGTITVIGTGEIRQDPDDESAVNYYWNGEEVSEETCESELARLFDADRATSIEYESGVEYDAFAAQLRS